MCSLLRHKRIFALILFTRIKSDFKIYNETLCKLCCEIKNKQHSIFTQAIMAVSRAMTMPSYTCHTAQYYAPSNYHLFKYPKSFGGQQLHDHDKLKNLLICDSNHSQELSVTKVYNALCPNMKSASTLTCRKVV